MKKDKKADQLGQRLRTISTELKQYIEKRIELTLLTVGESVSGWLAASIHRAVGAVLLLLGLCFLLVAAAIYIGELLKSESLGYVAVSVPLLFVGLLFLYLKPRGMVERLQHTFESEVMKAIEQDGRHKQKKIKSPD